MDYPIQLQVNEEVRSVIKRHPVRLWGRLIATAVIMILALILWFNFGRGDGFLSTVWTIVAVVAVVGGLIAGYVFWYRYNHDIWLITNQRLVDSVKSTPFSSQLNTADLRNIQDMGIRQRGIAQSMFQYGDVRCETAAAGRTFVFRGVADPQAVLHEIETARSEARL